MGSEERSLPFVVPPGAEVIDVDTYDGPSYEWPEPMQGSSESRVKKEPGVGDVPMRDPPAPTSDPQAPDEAPADQPAGAAQDQVKADQTYRQRLRMFQRQFKDKKQAQAASAGPSSRASANGTVDVDLTREDADMNAPEGDDSLFVRDDEIGADTDVEDATDVEDMEVNEDADLAGMDDFMLKRIYKKRKKVRREKKDLGTFSLDDEVDLLRFKQEFKRRALRALSDQRLAQITFGGATPGGEYGFPDNEMPDDDEEFEAMAHFAVNHSATRGQASDDGADSGNGIVGSRNIKRFSRRTRKKKTIRTQKDKLQDRNAKVSKKTTENVKTRKKNRRLPTIGDTGLLDVGSLLTGHVIRDAMGNVGEEPLPVMASKRRHQALKELVASLPPEKQSEARADQRALNNAIGDFVGKGNRVRTVEGQEGFSVVGMVSLLKPHQLLGTAFMRRREEDTMPPLGGICADQMGLGKTVMMIANIVNSLPPRNQEGPRTTLIVATNALVQQWNSEIKVHCKKKALKVCMQTAKSKLSNDEDSVHILEEFDVVLTTYDEVRKSYPASEPPFEYQTAEAKARWWKEWYAGNKGLLHRVNFLRVVLDEAQAIKNYKSHTSIACRALEAEYRWALSGTPIQNSVRELYPYFKFLKVQHTGSYKVFCQNYVGSENKQPTKTGIDRLQFMLNRIMIRRTHKDKVLGRPLVVLPRAEENIRWVQFNDVERAVYETVRERIINRINRLSRSRQLDGNYSHVLTMLLRLRQLTAHLLLLEKPMADLLEKEDHEKIIEIAESEGQKDRKGLREQQILRLRELIARGIETNDPQSSEAAMEDDSDRVYVRNKENVGQEHGRSYEFAKYMKSLREGDNLKLLEGRSRCSLCHKKPENPQISTCFHVYCEKCIEQLIVDAAADGEARARCKECSQLFGGTKPCDKFDLQAIAQQQAATDNDESDTDNELQVVKRRGRHRLKEAKRASRVDWIEQEGHNILPSAKTIEIKAQILNWIEEKPDVKIIIFTQFLDMIRILQKVCKAEGWPCTTYTGLVTLEERQKNIKLFQDDANTRVLLASLKAGGVGLNLTMAQKVIVVDPWWNSAVEQQAFARVFRIGQTQETSLTRFIVENTVDSNMYHMQKRKEAEIFSVMDQKAERRLTNAELFELFGGEVGEDENGQPFIMCPHKDTLPNPMADDDDMMSED